jgi:hypothetical protein
MLGALSFFIFRKENAEMDMSVMEHKLSCLEKSIKNALMFKVFGDPKYAEHLCELMASAMVHSILLNSGCKTPEEYEAFIASIPEEGIGAATAQEMLDGLMQSSRNDISEIFSAVRYEEEVDENGNPTYRATIEFSPKNFEEGT